MMYIAPTAFIVKLLEKSFAPSLPIMLALSVSLFYLFIFLLSQIEKNMVIAIRLRNMRLIFSNVNLENDLRCWSSDSKYVCAWFCSSISLCSFVKMMSVWNLCVCYHWIWQKYDFSSFRQRREKNLWKTPYFHQFY